MMVVRDLERREVRIRIQLELDEASEWAKYVIPSTLGGSGNRLLFHLSEAQRRCDVVHAESVSRRALFALAGIERATCEAVDERVYVPQSPRPPPASPTPPGFSLVCRSLSREEREARVHLSDELLKYLQRAWQNCRAAAVVIQLCLNERLEIYQEMEREIRKLSRAAVREAPVFLVAQSTAFFHQLEADTRRDVEKIIAVDWLLASEDVRRRVVEAWEGDVRAASTQMEFTFCLTNEWVAITREERTCRQVVLQDEESLRSGGEISAWFSALQFAQGSFDLFVLERYSRRVFEAMSLRTMFVLAVEFTGRRSVEDAFLEVLCRGKVIPFAMSLQFRRKQVAERIAALEGEASSGHHSPPLTIKHHLEMFNGVEPSSRPVRDPADLKAREAWKLHFELTALIETIHRAMASTILNSSGGSSGAAPLKQAAIAGGLSPSPPPSARTSAAGGLQPDSRAVSVSARCKKFDAMRLRHTQHVQSVAIFASPTKTSI